MQYIAPDGTTYKSLSEAKRYAEANPNAGDLAFTDEGNVDMVEAANKPSRRSLWTRCCITKSFLCLLVSPHEYAIAFLFKERKLIPFLLRAVHCNDQRGGTSAGWRGVRAPWCAPCTRQPCSATMCAASSVSIVTSCRRRRAGPRSAHALMLR
jgi:hypothetical protein